MTTDRTLSEKVMISKTVTLPRLNRLSPSLEGTALKIMEESGELAQAIGKFRGLSGEQQRFEEEEAMQMVARELVDVAQTAVTMMFVLEEQYGIDLETILKEHIIKLRHKGYCD
ncbi:MazG-like family protein [Desulfosporosinus sp. BICA1-9]|uniref:MazG-like family protein n=1 Tax=Desulfosporosinus sp. BICA1-9 TaxID=1531958 RepID=UPI00054B9276|nr:MazG-like family protein [Desulfosporosinus sp. BICA1-9]KJS46335.1 MAG: nucleotide pyrophosphohydrolase [Peptococcaceae bacterium BRH_c23]KJS90688.1 MAG: nucleotide pyrophosphohydrolase [Desulfosporosinus sp. BICA1-9]HBW34926.1 nucleotide pyrophosphohydrolase [Desulfosporosinus sp.]